MRTTDHSIPTTASIDFDPHTLRSEIIAAAYGSNMPGWLFEELVAVLYRDEEAE